MSPDLDNSNQNWGSLANGPMAYTAQVMAPKKSAIGL